jgi:hypothetical protein
MRLIGLLLVACAASAAYSQSNRPPPTVAERAEVYRRIAAIQSTAQLERLARETAASQDAAQLALILDRFFELDAAAAVKLAGELLRSGSPSFVGLLYDRLARSDVNEALSALSQIDELAEARAASMAVFRGLGADERAFELVAASLQGGAREQFRADGLAQLAATSPQRALQEALVLPNAEMRRSLAMSIVSRWAIDAPSEAIAAVDGLADPELRSLLSSTVLRNWRGTDTLLTYVESLDRELRGKALMSSALERLVTDDARRVALIVATLPEGEERTRLLWAFSNSYARQDPEAAVAWTRTLDPAVPEIVANAVRHVATRAPLRAFDLAAALDEPLRSQTYLSIVNGPVDETQLLALATRVLRIDDEQTRMRLVMTLVEGWASRRGDPDGALDWLNANEAAVPPEAFERVAFIYAHSNPTDAAARVDRVPSRARAAWIAAVTSGIATTDVQGATEFLERFRGEPGFDRGAPPLAMRIAEADPAAAARFLASVGTRGADGVAPEMAIARSWAQRDPAAAAAWALDLPPMQRTIALQMVTGIWGSQDPAAVRQWALGMPPGERRDQALTAAIRARGAASSDPALLAAFSDDRLRQGAAMNVILATAQTDVAAARRLIGEHIADPRMRAQAEQMVDSFARGTAPTPVMSPFGAGPTGLVPGGIVGGLSGFPPGAVRGVPFGVGGQPITIIGPDGRPVTLRPPAGMLPEPGPIALPPGAYIGPTPPIPAPAQPRAESPPLLIR